MSAQERITTRLQAEVDEKAWQAATIEQLKREQAEHRTSLGSILAVEIVDLYDLVDQANLDRRNWLKPAGFIMKKLTGRKLSRTVTHGYYDVRGYYQRHYELKGKVDGSAITVPYGAPEVTADGSFLHSWTVDLSQYGGESPRELDVRIYDTLTEERSGISERELRYAVLTDVYKHIGYDSIVTSFTDGKADDPLATVGNNGAEQALSIIRQARSVVEQKQ